MDCTVKRVMRFEFNTIFNWPVMLIAAGALVSVGFSQQNPDRLANDIVTKMVQSEASQLKNLQHYRMKRWYQLKTADGSKDVQMVARVEYDSATGKSIQVIEERGTEGLFRRGLRKVIEAEVRTSHTDGRAETRLAPENYRFRLAGTEVREGRKCYVLQLLPKRKSKYLLDGRAWVDAEDYGLVALEGRPAASVSFWVGKPFISQTFDKVGEFWLLTSNHSVVDARLIGRIALNIETHEVEMAGAKVAAASQRSPASKVAVD